MPLAVADIQSAVVDNQVAAAGSRRNQPVGNSEEDTGLAGGNLAEGTLEELRILEVVGAPVADSRWKDMQAALLTEESPHHLQTNQCLGCVHCRILVLAGRTAKGWRPLRPAVSEGRWGLERADGSVEQIEGGEVVIRL